jgi:hypothetical protein
MDSHVRTVRGETLYLAQVAIPKDYIHDYQFEDCNLLGPAIIALMGEVAFISTSFEGPSLEAMAWEVPENTVRIGAIAVSRCRFLRCRITGVGIAGTAETLEHFLANVRTQNPAASQNVE